MLSALYLVILSRVRYYPRYQNKDMALSSIRALHKRGGPYRSCTDALTFDPKSEERENFYSYPRIHEVMCYLLHFVRRHFYTFMAFSVFQLGSPYHHIIHQVEKKSKSLNPLLIGSKII